MENVKFLEDKLSKIITSKKKLNFLKKCKENFLANEFNDFESDERRILAVTLKLERNLFVYFSED